ncbi:FtsX-like permease family protein [Lachnoclostridium sp.]|uniref:FtsX-like permease family protein n=1 Tax=Lachnoclostridium sp. TaxID=2028282 RepID=UPI002898D806|nr:FtsX-like permease family protein [Lachnoclostridium sp.]
MNNSIISIYEDTFITIGTVEQKALSINTVTRWNAEKKDYELRQQSVYSRLFPASVLSFDGANYTQEPEKRSYYGSYAPDYTLVHTDKVYDELLIAEVTPLEDCIPNESVKIKISKLIWGNSSLDGTTIWFCNHYYENPKPLEKGKSYSMVLIKTTWAHGSHFEKSLDADLSTLEYGPGNIQIEEYESDGTLMKEPLENEKNNTSPYYEVTEGFYDRDIGKRLLNLAKGYSMSYKTQPVTGTNSTILLMPFYNGDAYISQGRDILDAEYEDGKKVCLVSDKFAINNNLTVGNKINVQLYFTNSKSSAGRDFLLYGGRVIYSSNGANGAVYSVFEDSWYTIVGIYTASQGAGQYNYSMGGDEIVVPINSIENRSSNIVAYGPMKGYNTSFQLPNGNIEEFLSKWEKYGTGELEITFYDMGYSQIESGLENMKHMSLVLLVIGLLMVIFLLLFYSHLFISNQKVRTAIERCLGVTKKNSKRSLLIGIILLLFLGSTIGCSMGGLLSRHISTKNLNHIYYDSRYSNRADMEIKETILEEKENTLVIVLTTLVSIIFIILLGILISIHRINQNLKMEPMKLLNEKRNQ